MRRSHDWSRLRRLKIAYDLLVCRACRTHMRLPNRVQTPVPSSSSDAGSGVDDAAVGARPKLKSKAAFPDRGPAPSTADVLRRHLQEILAGRQKTGKQALGRTAAFLEEESLPRLGSFARHQRGAPQRATVGNSGNLVPLASLGGIDMNHAAQQAILRVWPRLRSPRHPTVRSWRSPASVACTTDTNAAA